MMRDLGVDGGSFLETGNMAGGAGGGTPVKNAVLHLVLVSFAEITGDLRISAASNNKSLFLLMSHVG